MLSVLVGDIVYIFVETHALHVPSTLVDIPYGFGYLFLIMTVLHPSMREVTKPVPGSGDDAHDRPARGGRRRARGARASSP